MQLRRGSDSGEVWVDGSHVTVATTLSEYNKRRGKHGIWNLEPTLTQDLEMTWGELKSEGRDIPNSSASIVSIGDSWFSRETLNYLFAYLPPTTQIKIKTGKNQPMMAFMNYKDEDYVVILAPRKVGFLGAEGSFERPPQKCVKCGEMTRSWITPEGKEGGYCPNVLQRRIWRACKRKQR